MVGQAGRQGKEDGERGSDDNGTLLERIDWVIPDRPLTTEIARVLEVGHLRGEELWHVACALFLEPKPRELGFVTLDARQLAVARERGFGIR